MYSSNQLATNKKKYLIVLLMDMLGDILVILSTQTKAMKNYTQMYVSRSVNDKPPKSKLTLVLFFLFCFVCMSIELLLQRHYFLVN